MNKLSLNLWFSIALFVSTVHVCSGCVEEERNGLLKLNPLFRYLLWTGFENSDCCGWVGVLCDNNAPRRVIRLDLDSTIVAAGYINRDPISSSYVLNATLLLPFQHLQHLNLSRNRISHLQNGHDLGKLKKLEVLDLHDNIFNNTSIFQSLSALTSLAVLDLSRNFLNGTLFDYDRELCKLKNLRELSLARNMLSGSIPECFKHLTSLKSLDLSYNELFGNLRPFILSTSVKYLSLGRNQFDANLMFNSFVEHGFQFKYLDLSSCNLNTSTTNLVKFLCNNPNLIVLDLSNNNLHGEFSSSSFKNNLELKSLVLRNNSLTGRIDIPVGPLLNLEFFDASYNHILGELQSNIGQVLPKLKFLNVENNELGGELPTSLGKIESLNLAYNKLSGNLPEELGLSCERLRVIHLSNNRLEGQIPNTLFNLTELSDLDLSNNQFTGYIPSSIFQSFSLIEFNISQNYISGRIPHWLGTNLTDSLKILAMHNNYIQGNIPPELCNTSLSHLDLSQNQLSGPLPSCLTTMPYLEILHLQHNKLTYPTQTVLPSNSSFLLTFDLSHNHLTGEIPIWFGFFRDLKVLLLKGNRFSGSIPHELCRLHNLGIMDLSHNNLSGSIPLCFTKIPFGKTVVDKDQFSDRMPAGWVNDDIPSNIIISDLIIPFDVPSPILYTAEEEVEFMMKSRSNFYKGDIINYMSGMDLACNNLNGSIPMDIRSLTEIRALNLSHNHFTGVIPSSLSNMKQIESMDFSHNKLSGQIPSNLTGLTSLAVFSVAYNNLSGRVPEMVAQFSTFGETSYDGNQFLCGPPLTKTCNTKKDPATTTSTSVAERIDLFGIDPISFFASFAGAYATYLSAFVIVLCINPHWRRRWFHFIDACLSFVFRFYAEAIHRRGI